MSGYYVSIHTTKSCGGITGLYTKKYVFSIWIYRSLDNFCAKFDKVRSRQRQLE